MGKHILTATNITTNPINNSVAEYACVDIQCIGSNALNNATANNDTEINRSIYERLHIQSSNLEQPKPRTQLNNQTTRRNVLNEITPSIREKNKLSDYPRLNTKMPEGKKIQIFSHFNRVSFSFRFSLFQITQLIFIHFSDP